MRLINKLQSLFSKHENLKEVYLMEVRYKSRKREILCVFADERKANAAAISFLEENTDNAQIKSCNIIPHTIVY